MKHLANTLHFILTVVLITVILLQQQCHPEPAAPQVVHTQTRIVIDSQAPPPVIIRMPTQPLPAPVVIYPDDRGEPLPLAMVDTAQDLPAHLYRDSIEDENQTIYSSITVRGELLASKTSYKLKIPTVVTKTITTTKTIQEPVSSLLLVGGIGLSPRQRISFGAGLQYVHAKGWAVGYEYDFMNQTHEVKLGLPLYQFKPPDKPFKRLFGK